MSRDWTEEELQAASKAMVEMGNMSYEEFTEKLKAVVETGLMSYEEFVASCQEVFGPAQEGDT